MAGGNVIKSFLAKLAFSVDATSQAKFVNALGGATRGASNLGTEITLAAAAVYSGVAIIASQYEKLYYTSRRTGETAENILSLEYAFSQIGLSAEQGRKALEGFTLATKMSPGLAGLLSALGVTGEGPAAQFESLIRQLKGMPFNVGAAYAQMFGVDPQTLLMLEQGLGQLDKYNKERSRFLKEVGFDTKEAAEEGKNFEQALRGTWMKIGTLIDTLATDLEKSGLTEWTKRFGDAVEQILINKKRIEDDARAKGADASFADKYLPEPGQLAGFAGSAYGDIFREYSPLGMLSMFLAQRGAQAVAPGLNTEGLTFSELSDISREATRAEREAGHSIVINITGVPGDPHVIAARVRDELRQIGDELRNSKGRTP